MNNIKKQMRQKERFTAPTSKSTKEPIKNLVQAPTKRSTKK